MTAKIERFLAEHRPPTPCLIVDLDVVGAAFKATRDALPRAELHYAVKANPAPEILRILVALGSSFDAASPDEIDRCLAAGASPECISYGNTIKKEADIRHAFVRGVRRYAMDSAGELEKIAVAAPGARVYCRILTSNDGARWPLDRKFGCAPDMARDLLIAATGRGLAAEGIAFHVGSQQTDPAQWKTAIARAATLFSELRERGVEATSINLGGGFPVAYRDTVPSLADLGVGIMDAMRQHFGDHLPGMVIEPGRCIVANAGVLETEVVLVSTKEYGDAVRWVYLDVGRFSGLAETMDEAITYPICTPHDGGTEGPVIIAGPTCDGADVLYEHAGYTLPLALIAGDRVRLLNTGAYTTTYASIGFNGMGPLNTYYV